MKVGAGNQTWVLEKSRQCSYALKHLSIPQQTLLLSLLAFLSYQAIPKTLLATDSLYPIVFLFQIAVWFFTLLLGSRLKTSSSRTGWTAALNQDEEGEIGFKTEFMRSDPNFQCLLCLGLKCPSKGHVLKAWSPDHGTVGKLWSI